MTPQQFKSWRKRLGLTQAQAADAIGMSLSQIKNYESGRAEAGIPLYVELACAAIALGVSRYPTAAE